MKSRTPRLICDDHRVRRGEAADADDRLARHAASRSSYIAPGSPPRRSAKSGCRWARSTMLTSHRSGSSASICDDVARLAVGVSAAVADASRRRRSGPRPRIVSPTASLVSSISSRSRRARFSRLPPYSSMRSFLRRCEELLGDRQIVGRVDVDDVESRPSSSAAPRRDAIGESRGCRCLSIARACTGIIVLDRPMRRRDRRTSREHSSPPIAPLCMISIAASAPCACTARPSAPARECRGRPTAALRRNGATSPVGWISHLLGRDHRPAALGLDSAHRRAAPPAWRQPMPVQCGTW